MNIDPANGCSAVPVLRHASPQRRDANSLAERSVFELVRRGESHAKALKTLDSHNPPLLGAFEVKASAHVPNMPHVASERLDHLEGMVVSFGEASRNLRDKDVLAAVASIKGSAEASTYGAALGTVCTKSHLDAATWISCVSIIAQNHVHGPRLQRMVARGRIAADDPHVVNWQKQKEQQPFYDEVAAATEAFQTDDDEEKAPAWFSWMTERTKQIPNPLH